ncbi:MAG: type II toxin-antitoxin system HicA family toxin [Treponema sp.]|jgi:predicted RNA binding protein YcfA (HicA-like mRNA interferase family)|nr:type II toxin-antitoxin system HicA family toxin [Treponema sp.]
MQPLKPVPFTTFEKFLTYAGCVLVRQKGSHRSYQRPGLIRPIIVPYRNEIPVYIIKNTLRNLGMDTDTFRAILGQL